ncbi:MAG: hypothetical protein HKM93_21235 [Desulfobacteraceae bacterium]|nr:hypothetical protein [Desulfobacteraceae bacterium]
MDANSGPCRIVVKKITYEINSNGIIRYNVPKGDASFIQPVLPEHFYVQSVQSYDYKDDIIFIFEITDDEAGSTIILMCNPSSSTLYWTVELGTFNPSPPLVEADSIYIGAIGTIVKLDLKTGLIIWKHSGFYERETSAFNSFLKPIKRNNIIVFQDNKLSFAKYRGVREIWVNDESGKIIRK